ncbi:TPA_asm: M [Panicum betacytorhabdovirus 1]|nr:TPA_asm: M [Panicum betacytorhabdovirus 1]
MNKMTLKFLFVMLDLEIVSEMAGTAKPSNIDDACFLDLLKKSEVPDAEAKMITRLLSWYLTSNAGKENYHIEETVGATLDFNNATTHDYKLPPYILVRYNGPEFPEQCVEKVSGRSEYLQAGVVIGSCSINIKRLKIREVTREVARSMFKKNQSYLIKETFEINEASSSKKK